MTKWIKFSKHTWDLAGSIVIFDKINFYYGVTDHWGLGFEINLYDRSLTFDVLHWYFGVEILHSEKHAMSNKVEKIDLFGDKSEAIKFGEKENTASDTRLNFSGMQ